MKANKMKIYGGNYVNPERLVNVDIVLEYYSHNKEGRIESLLSFWIETDNGKKHPIIGTWDKKPLVEISVELSMVNFTWNGFRIKVRELFPGLKLGEHTLEEFKHGKFRFLGYEHNGIIIRLVTE